MISLTVALSTNVHKKEVLPGTLLTPKYPDMIQKLNTVKLKGSVK